MEKTVSAFEARRQFGSLLNDVDARGEKIVVTRHGAPVAALVPMSVYEQWRRERDAFFALWDELKACSTANSDLTDEEAMELALEAVAAVRAEQRTRT